MMPRPPSNGRRRPDLFVVLRSGYWIATVTNGHSPTEIGTAVLVGASSGIRTFTTITLLRSPGTVPAESVSTGRLLIWTEIPYLGFTFPEAATPHSPPDSPRHGPDQYTEDIQTFLC